MLEFGQLVLEVRLEFERRQEFFNSLPARPDWLCKVQWEVLTWFLDRNVPCEPARKSFLENAAKRIKKRHPRLATGAYPAVEKALEKGLEKIDAHLNQPVSREEKVEPKPCWWNRD